MKHLYLLFVTFATAALGQGTFVFSPRLAPNGSTSFPFFTDTSWGRSIRYQQVYNASDFIGQGGPIYRITDLSFGGAIGNMAGATTLSNVMISFSTTGRGADGLSSMFAENIGFNNTVVSSGLLQIQFNNLDSYPFRIHLQQPFLYDPALGNLLMDVRNFETLPLEGGLFRLMGGSNVQGDTTSSIFAFDASSATAPFVDTAGLITRFTVESIPEPGPGALLLLGAGLAVFFSCRSRP